jgi:Protein of unknown function (DUF3800)
MTWLLFMDESGHDHRQMPMEVRGGVALHVNKIWDFVRAWQRLELDAFGVHRSNFKIEVKGSKLLNKDRFATSAQRPWLPDVERRKLVQAFLSKSRARQQISSVEFAAYGQACIEMARGAFELLTSHDAKLFASAIPCGVRPPLEFTQEDYLRKDQVFLFERFFYFLESQKSFGLLVMDETEKSGDRKFVSRIEQYFSRTQTGRQRTAWIVPSPLFVSSDMSVGVQAADLCLYAINWGFRLNSWKDIRPIRPEIAAETRQYLDELQWKGDGYRDGRVYASYGIVLVPDPYSSRGP